MRKDKELKELSLLMMANWMETRDPMLSATDYKRMGWDAKLRPLDSEQQAEIIRLREMSREV